MQIEGGDHACAKNKVVHARLSENLKEKLDGYARAKRLTTSSAVSELLARALEDHAALDGIASDVSDMARRFDQLEKTCGLAAKRAGKASQASLGALALLSWLAPDIMRLLANEALLRGQVLSKLLGNDAAAANVKVPASLGRLANTLSVPELFKMSYSEIGGKLSRDPSTELMPALASAVRLYDLESLGILDMDEAEWQRAGTGDAKAASRLAAREAKKARRG